MSLPTYEMIEGSSALAADIQESDQSVFVKGFASVESPDRQNHFAPASEFNVDTFLNTGTLLRDHKFIKDPHGNDVSAGVVREAEAAFISDQEDDEFVISSARNMEVINRLPVKRYPDLKVGDRGLFVVAEVTNDLAKEEVLKGHLGAFSWRGLVQLVKGVDIGQPYDLLKMIDLKEISIVHMPQHTSSALTIGKSVDFETSEAVPTEIIKFKLSKSYYPTVDVAKAYLQARGIEYTSITENDTDYFAVVQDQAQFDIEKSYLVKLGDVSVVTAARLDHDSSNAEQVGELNDIPVEDNTVSEETQVVKSLRVCLVDEGLIDKYFPNCKKEVLKSEEITNEEGEAAKQEVVHIDLQEADFEALQAAPAEPAKATEPAAEATQEPTQEPSANDALVAQLAKMQDDFNKRFEAFEARLPSQEQEQDPPKQESAPAQESAEELAEAIKSEILNDLSGLLKINLTNREERREVAKGDSGEVTDQDLFGQFFV